MVSSKLTPEQKAHVDKWLNTLENGMYQQGHSYLKFLKEDGTPAYCCLGVAAEAVCGRQFLHDPERTARGTVKMTVLHYESGNNKTTMNLFLDDAEKLGLHKEIQETEIAPLMRLTGLPASSIYGVRESVCIQMNDEAGMTFKEIANVFREMGWDK